MSNGFQTKYFPCKICNYLIWSSGVVKDVFKKLTTAGADVADNLVVMKKMLEVIEYENFISGFVFTDNL